MTVKSQKHVHKYYRSSQDLWTCAIPSCTHFLPLNVADTITNRLSQCWKCGETFQMTEQSVKMEKPVCMDCSIDTTGLNNFLKEVGM